METLQFLLPGVAVASLYLLAPLVSERSRTPWDSAGLLSDDTASDRPPERETPRPPSARTGPNRRAMTDGGRVCHSCGSYVEGDFMYCAECLTPRV